MSGVLAITFDGLLQPLGYSQVARVAIGLAQRGHRYTIVSLERQADLGVREHVARVEHALQQVGIRWVRRGYVEGGDGRAIVENMRRIAVAAREAVSLEPPRLVHARALHSAIIARGIRFAHGIPYMFDARGYWVDEQVVEGRRFQSPRMYRLAKALERRLFSDASLIVTLTDLQADDVRQGRLGAWRGRPVRCIPTCADYQEFRPRGVGASALDLLAELPADARTIGLVGSLNRSYLVEESLALARAVIERDRRFFLVVLSTQCDEYRRVAVAAGIPESRMRFAQVPHSMMSKVLPHLDWGLLLLRENAAKRASMPTKLAEFFASGVQVAQIGCNAEVAEWVRRAGNGFVLTGVSPADLDAAAERIVAAPEMDVDSAERTRDRTATHFSLEAGIDRYHELIESLIPSR